MLPPGSEEPSGTVEPSVEPVEPAGSVESSALVEPSASVEVSAPVEPSAAVAPKPSFFDRLRSGTPRFVDHAAIVGMIFGIVLAIFGFGRELDTHYPIKQWLIWHYLVVWICSIVWVSGCGLVGFAIVERLLPRVPLREQIVQSFAVGVYVFYACMIAGGFLHIFGRVFSVALPIVLLLVGLFGARKSLPRVVYHLKAWHAKPKPPRPLWAKVVIAYGLLCIVGLYFNILTPKNANFDSQWYHLGLGQQWATMGGIYRSPEGWIVEALPHFAAVIYAWAWQLPGFSLFNIVELIAHLEFVILLLTLVGIPVLVRSLVPRARTSETWVALFLFPSIFIYDASLHSGNDHVAAFWAVPIFLALRRGYAKLDPRQMFLLALSAAGAILTKYQAVSLVVAPALVIVFRALWLALRRKPDARYIVGPVVCLFAGLILTAPHWAKNWIWYGDPLYPALYKHMSLRPWHPDLAAVMESNWERMVRRPKGPLVAQLKETFYAGFTFSFTSHTWEKFHGKWPEFGSLFTLSLLWLPFLRNTKRIWVLFICAQIGVFTWYYMSHVERYLQALIPWMSAVVAASLILLCRKGWEVRIPAGAICALQVFWGGDAYFFPTHAMLGDAPMRVSAQLLASGYAKKYGARNQIYEPFQQISERLPKKAVVLLHDFHPRLGLRQEIITDDPGYQGLFRYGRLTSGKDILELYQSVGITHVVWPTGGSSGYDNLAGDLRFFEFATNWVQQVENYGGMSLAQLPKQPLTRTVPDVVAYLGCTTFVRGLYKLTDMDVLHRGKAKPPFRNFPAVESDLSADIAEAGYVVRDPACRPNSPASFPGFVRVLTRNREELWIRKL